jgi:succinate dehydrogenase / fumarate reductase iron-sulfur subunit
MKIVLQIERFDPETDRNPYFREYTVDADPMERILDLLMAVHRTQDSSLGFRKSCAHGVCGSDAMRINGVERLACKTLVKDVTDGSGGRILIQPLLGLPVERDLMVAQDVFFEKYRSVKPYLMNDEPVSRGERNQTPEQRRRFDDATNCILCEACYSACPVLQKENPSFLGPAAIVQAARFLDDSRDGGFEVRLDALDNPDGVWPCANHFKCTQVCPRGIKVTRLINMTKRKITQYRKQRGENVNDGT